MSYNSTPECFVFDGGNNASAMTAALMNGGMAGGGMWNNPIWALVFLAILGRNNGLFGGNSESKSQLDAIQAQLNSNQNSTLLMDAIRGNGAATHELATNLNCDINAVQNAINGVQSSVCAVGNQVGMGSAQVINAIQSGDMALSNTLQNCCCNIRQDITKMGYDNIVNNMQQSQLIQNGFSQIGYASAEQTCALKQSANDNTNRIISKLDAMEDSRKDREISSLTAMLAASNARAERQAELAPIMEAIKEVQCKQPQTVTLPYSCATAVPTNLVYGLYGNSYYNGGVFG